MILKEIINDNVNGNIIKYLSKNITNIQYNLLNLPDNIYTTINGERHAFLYDYDGNKLYANTQSMVDWTIKDEKHWVDNMYYENWKLKRINLEGGYGYITTDDGQYHFYQKDHLGNNRLVVNQNGTVEQTNHYYPYGMTYAESTGTVDNPYKYNGKELDTTNGINLYDYSARYMDPTLGRFTTMDPMAEKYYSISPYAYCMDNPINAIDKKGNVVLFINGYHQGDGGRSEYWGGMDNVAMNKIGDHNARYYDGSAGEGITTTISEGNREIAGEDMGLKEAAEIFGNLKDGETIKIMSHSMGGAFSKGMIRGIQEYAQMNKIDISGKIEFEADLAPFQAGEQTVIQGINTIQVSHSQDYLKYLSSRLEEGNVQDRNYHLTTGTHSISSFENDINHYVPSSEHNSTGYSVWEQNPKDQTQEQIQTNIEMGQQNFDWNNIIPR